ncbi:MAG: hypothetical protein JKX70_07925, partial [Phycisphaerales bacterium]|nr:hypothetical protein [Phycisphaerales bacterium]
MTQQDSPNTNTPSELNELRLLKKRLSKLCTRVRLVLVLQSVLLSVSVVVVAIIGIALLDYLLRLPSGIRMLTLLGIAALMARSIVVHVLPALRVRITKSDLALRLEHHDPSLRGLVASAIDLGDELSTPESSDDISAALTHAALSSVNRRLQGRIYPSLLNLRSLGKAMLLIALIALGIGAMSVRSSSHVLIGMNRVLLPWIDTSWPMRFAIADTTNQSPRPVDIAVPIRALIGSPTTPADANARGVVLWRVLDEDQRSINDWTKTMLVAQHVLDESGIPVYEQLLDVHSVVGGHKDESFTLEYKIQSRDDASRIGHIVLVRPPELVQTTIDISLPAYASALSSSDADTRLVQSGQIETGLYDSAVSPVLGGSRVRILWQFSKPVVLPTDMTPIWVGDLALGNIIERIGQPSPNTIVIELIANTSASIEPGVLDAMGIPVRTPIVLSLGVLTDQSPGASITQPMRDEAVSSHAVIELQAELSDDFGLSSAAIQATHARTQADSSGAPHEPIDQGRTLAQQQYNAQQRATITHTLDLATLQVTPGDELWIEAIAWDLRQTSNSNAQTDDLGMTRSAMRVLSIVEDSELIEQARNALNPIRSSLRQLDDQQAQLQSRLRDGQVTSGRDQRALAQRLDANKRTIDQLRDSLDRNRLDDPELKSLLNDASSILGEGVQAGQNASDQIDRGETQRAQDNQRTVRDRIGELLSVLDRGQDAWLALRSVQQLRDELEAIRDDTNDFNAKTAGKSLDQLTPNEQSALERIMDRQLGLADDAREALSTLDEQAKALEETDPTQAEALRKAAQQGRSAQIEQQLNKAGEQIASNQTSSAAQTQTQVLEELEEMLEELENTIKNRDNALRRELASIIESIQALIKAQETEITLVEDNDADQRMIALVGNTLAVRDDALGAFPETRSIADLITKAANSQTNAINALREEPASIAQASGFERASLLHLNSALEEAQRLDDQAAQRQARQLRTELRDAYQASLEAQITVRDESLVLVGRVLKRRERADARTLAKMQSAIRDELAELLDQTQELSDAPMFALAHAQLDRLMEKSASGLTQRSIEQRVSRSQNASLIILSTLVEVLSDTPPDQEPEDFDDGSSSGSGSGSGSGQEEPVIPPIAQLKLLRSMQ